MNILSFIIVKNSETVSHEPVHPTSFLIHAELIDLFSEICILGLKYVLWTGSFHIISIAIN